MREPNFGWDLPPGVTQKQIDDWLGDDEEGLCPDCGEEDCTCERSDLEYDKRKDNEEL